MHVQTNIYYFSRGKIQDLGFENRVKFLSPKAIEPQTSAKLQVVEILAIHLP
jgi:hypothetical protein